LQPLAGIIKAIYMIKKINGILVYVNIRKSGKMRTYSAIEGENRVT